LGYKSVQTIANGVPSNDQFSRSDNFWLYSRILISARRILCES
jgi:hypothetical protein